MRGTRVSRAGAARLRRRAPIALAVLGALLTTSSAAAQQILPAPAAKPGHPFCLKPEETWELYGPTDIGATTGNGRLSVAVNPQGTLSVLRWPSISYYEQLRYYTVDRDLPRLGLAPNEGALSGLALELSGGERTTVWLRDLPSEQLYASEDSDTVLTRYRSRELGLRVEITDVVPPDADVLMRSHALRLEAGSPVRSATLIAFANLNPTASKRPWVPTEDWCEEVGGTDRARYDAGSDALVYEISETDQSVGLQRSVAVAIGASRGSVGHQVGADTYTGHPSTLAGPPSAYDDAADGSLSGNDGLGPAEVDAALAVPIGERPVTIAFAAAPNGEAAARLLERYRVRDARSEADHKRRSLLHWLAHAPRPRGAPPAVERLAKRALISLRQVIDTAAGRGGDKVAIAASVATQSPYFLDWIQDGAYFNEVLDVIGHPELVERHNLFYAEVQHKLEEGAPPGSPLSACQQPTPDGAWFMTNYADGGDAGVITWEINEAAFGLWALWRHTEHLQHGGAGAAAVRYLRGIYPTLRRTAEFLVAFRDPATGLTPATACEDDNPHEHALAGAESGRPGRPTMHSAGPVLLAMRSAEAAAELLAERQDAARYRARRIELEQAIERTYRTPEGAWTTDFGASGGWALWPVRVRPYDDPRSRAQAEVNWERVRPTFEAPRGPQQRGYGEVRILHGLAHFYAAIDPAGMERVKHGLRWISEVQAAWQGTGILGEAWYVRDGRVISVVSQPHVATQLVFYLTALEAYGRAPACARTSGLLAAGVRPSRRGLRFTIRARSMRPVTVDIYRQSAGRRIVAGRRLKRFAGRHRSFRWSGRGARLRDGYYLVRLRSRAGDGSTDVRRVALRRVGGRFRRGPAIERRSACGLVRSFALGRPVFGGAPRARALGISLRLAERRRARVEVRRGRRLVKRYRARRYAAGRTYRLRLSPKRLQPGRYRVTLRVGRGRAATLGARRL
jgi:hypothetical protein